MRVRLALWGLAAAAALVIGITQTGVLRRPAWHRQNPLQNPVEVTAVRDGVITLATGAAFHPAGVVRRGSVTPTDFDLALRIMTAQGVVVIRDLGDGRAFLMAEPKFYNWCGTSSPRWAGTYYRCRVSELLVATAFADPAIDEPGLTPRERWRLEGVRETLILDDVPTRLSTTQMAIRIDTMYAMLSDDYDDTLASVWKPPPD